MRLCIHEEDRWQGLHHACMHTSAAFDSCLLGCCRQVREGGRVMALQDGDTLCFAAQCNDQNVLMVACSQGKVVTYLAQDIPERAGRATQGVRAKNLKKGMLPLQLPRSKQALQDLYDLQFYISN